MTWQRYNKNLRKSPLLAEYFLFWTNSTPIWGFFEMMRSFGIHVRSFRADCGSYSEDIVKVVMAAALAAYCTNCLPVTFG